MSHDPMAVTASTLREWGLPEPGGDKEARGRVLVVGGGASTPGAVILSGESALRVGAGKLRLVTAATVAPSVGAALPEARVVGLPQTPSGDVDAAAADTVLELADGCAAVLLGPGMVEPKAAVCLLEKVLPHLTCAVVLDALASAFVTDHPEGVGALAERAVLTLNPHELAETLKLSAGRVHEDQLGATVRLAQACGAVVLCGGERKTVAGPDGRCWTVDEGGPGMAVSGSGDVQSGLVTGLVARGAAPEQAAVWGAYLHGAAGERLAEAVGTVGFLARELPGEIPALLTELC